MVRAWKDGARRDMDGFFSGAMTRAVAHLSPALAPVTIVVAVPARSVSTRRRGADLPAILARAAASGLAGEGVPAPVVPCLRNVGAESRTLGVRGRWTGVAAGIRVASTAPGETALLVDDVVTSGASIARSCWALERSGVAVAAAVTLAATPRPGETRDFGPCG
jgi:predicted amidophosphoribosyltransferase